MKARGMMVVLSTMAMVARTLAVVARTLVEAMLVGGNRGIGSSSVDGNAVDPSRQFK